VGHSLDVELVSMIRDCGGVSGAAKVIGDGVGPVSGADGAVALHLNPGQT
jgi:hypothetical protein